MKFDGKGIGSSPILISDIKELVLLTNAEYTKLVEWVKENKPEFMSTQNTQLPSTISAPIQRITISTTSIPLGLNIINVDGYLNDLKDEEIHRLSWTERLAKGAFPLIPVARLW